MSDPDQDEIRRKRLARLSQAGAGAGMQGEKSKPAKVSTEHIRILQV